jgi:small subunit ribosomal protein S20
MPNVLKPNGEGIFELANTKSAEKRIRVAERRRLRNRPYVSAARTYVKKAELAIRAGDQDTAALAVGDALSMLDRVAGKHIIHRNNAARRKSRLMAKFNKMAAAA